MTIVIKELSDQFFAATFSGVARKVLMVLYFFFLLIVTSRSGSLEFKKIKEGWSPDSIEPGCVPA